MIITFFSPIYSTKNPEGIDITPYAKKKEKGRKAAIDKLKLNALIMSGTSGPMIFVKNEITKDDAIKQLSNVENIELCGIDEYNVDEVLDIAKSEAA